ncbi:hypothetical protein SAY86_009335 [Trapa natans]|uniref:DNA replication licensing factor MCM5 n=1 Tax=Trapa natans TaxID=22666 RepID=A0AAN7L3R2_TRANT|nr:hypothetical protein SAY86_009335 [Trapa natans]
MSGWDQGRLYYTDQPTVVEYGGVAATASPDSVRSLFKEFIRGFKKNNIFHYRESLLQNPSSLLIDMDDLDGFNSDLTGFLRSSPADYLALFESVAEEVLASLKASKDDVEKNEPDRLPVQILLTSNELPISMRCLGAQDISKLVRISGIAVAASDIMVKAIRLKLVCENCKNVKEITCPPGLDRAIVPRMCDRVHQHGEKPCPPYPWIVVHDESKLVDIQTIKFQQSPKDLPEGMIPSSILLSLDRTLVQFIALGKELTITGIYSTREPSTFQKGAFGIKKPYIRVVGIDEETDEDICRYPFTDEEVEEFKKFASHPNVYQHICSKIAPSISGLDDVKKAVACLLFGGSRKVLDDGVKIRGDINVLLVGDPATAKSQILKFIQKTAPIVVYTSGKGSSAAGLTASVIRDPKSGQFHIQPGAMILADGGVVCIDEFDKMRTHDRVALHEAMEQQTISITKAGISTVLNSRTSVVAAANPPSGHFDELKTAEDNINLQTTILSRFDLIFFIKDSVHYHKDKVIQCHMLFDHFDSYDCPYDSNYTNLLLLEKLNRYIQYCRAYCNPRLSETASTMLQNIYISIRQDTREQANYTGKAAAIPITIRQLEAIIRISEALAKMKLSNVATEEDLQEAFRLFNISTMDATRSGINSDAKITPEIASEIKQAEAHIKRRLGIGKTVSTTKLINGLTRMGLNKSIIVRALVIMHQRYEIEYKSEGRAIVGKACVW